MSVAAVCIDDACRLSHCCECDAHPGECSHRGPRYLAPISYEPVKQDGKTIGWRVPEHERERWEHPVKGVRPPEPGTIARDLDELQAELERHVFVDAGLERALRAAHEVDALRTTKLVEHVIAQTLAGRLESPGGLLWKRARDIAQRPEPDSA